MVESLWLYYALAASTIWGINYVFAEKLLEKGFPISLLMALESALAFPIFLGLSYMKNEATSGFTMLKQDPQTLWLLGAVIVAFLSANFFVFSSIQAKNATLAGLIEITFPIFVILFTWLFFKEVHLNLYSAAGGLLVMLGVAIIYLKG